MTQWRCFYKNNTLKDNPFYYVQLWNDNNKFEDKDIYFFNAKHSEENAGASDKDDHLLKDLLEMNYEQSLAKLKLAKSKIGKELVEWIHLFFKESAAVYYVLFRPAIAKFGSDAHLTANAVHSEPGRQLQGG